MALTSSQAVRRKGRGEPREVKETYEESGIREQTQTELLPWGAPSARTGDAPSALRGRRAACKRTRFIVCLCKFLRGIKRAERMLLQSNIQEEWVIKS